MLRAARLPWFLGSLLALGCAGAPPPPAAAPPQPPEAEAPAPPAEEPPPPVVVGLGEAPAGTPPAPAACQGFVERVAASGVTCADEPAALVALAHALGQDEATRDAELRALEGCASFAPGVMRSLRAELAPVGCADVLVEPVLVDAAPSSGLLGPASSPAATSPGLSPAVADVLRGLGVGARLSRLAHEPPRITGAVDKPRFLAFFNAELLPWVAAQATAIQRLSVQGAGLTGHGKAIAAIEAGSADLRFVDVVRAVPLPAEMARDPEVKEVYYSALDQALEPRKERGRDAALVGLRLLAETGVLVDPRVERARGLLAKLYGGRRIDALDGLLLTPLPPLSDTSVEVELARRLPTFHMALLMPAVDPTRPELVRALLERGFPVAYRARLDGGALTTEARTLWARAYVEFGRRYFRSGDFARAAALAQVGTQAAGALSAEARLVLGLGRALQGGPADAAAMMLAAPLVRTPADVALLDELAAKGGAVGGVAGYDAAYLLSIAPPPEADARTFRDLEARFGKAARALTDPAARAEAKARGKAAADTAAVLEQAARQRAKAAP